MITNVNVNFKSFAELCPNFKGKFQANGLHDSVKGFAGCYLVKTYEFDKKTKKTKTYYKIGYKGLTNNGKSDSNRIKDYAKLNVYCLGFIFQEKEDKREFDIEIHNKLKSFYGNVFESGTFFGNDEEGCHFKDYKEDDDTFILNCKQACYHYRTGTKPKAIKTQFWGPRVGSQDICIEKAFNYFSNNNSLNEFLIAAKCRYGKCYTSLKIIDKLETENVLKHNLHLITSYRPSDIIAEWYDTVITHNDFNWDVFVHPSLQNKFPHAKTLDDLNKNSKGIVIASTQCLIKKSKINDGVDYSKYSKKLQNLKFGVVCADEDDVGNNKENAINFRANNLNYENVIRITGTAYQELIWESNKFNDENTYIFDYIEEQKLKAQYKHLGINNPYKDMASMKFYTINLAEKIFNEEIGSEKGFSLNEFFRTKENDKTTFVHEIQVKKFITKTLNSDVCYNEDEEQWAILESESFKLKNVLIKLPAGTIEAFDKIFKNLGYNNYEFIKYTGDNRDAKNKEELVSKIEKANAENKKTITYTVYRLGRGVSVKQFNGVLHWAGTEESDIGCYEQFNFRGQTPNANKEVCYVFDYAPNRISLMQEQIAVFRAKLYNKSIDETRKEVLNYYSAFKLNNCEWKQKSYEEYLNELSLVRDNKALTEDLVKVSPIGLLGKLKNTEHNVTVNTNDIDKPKYKVTGTKSKKNENGLTEEEIQKLLKKQKESEEKKQRRNFVECINNTLRFVWVRNEGKPFNSKIYKKYILDEKVKKWIKETEIKIPDNFYELLDLAYSDNLFVISFDRYLISTYNKKSFDELCPIKLGKHDYVTPYHYVEQMWEKSIKAEKIENDEIFIEPCSKIGEFSKYGIEKKYLKENNCYFICRNDWMASLTSLNIFNEFDYTKHKNQITINKIENKKYKINNGKIVIGELNMPKGRTIMNPPYDGNLHLEILDLVNNITNKPIVNISPIRWLLDPVSDKKNTSDVKTFENLKNNINEIEIKPAKETNKAFGIETGDLGIYTLNSKTGNKFDYIAFQKNYIGEKRYELLMKLVNFDTAKIKNKMKKGFDQNKWGVPLATVRGFGSGKNYDIVSLIHNEPYHNYADFLKTTFKKKDVKEKDPDKQWFLEFDTYEEAKNFIESTRTKVFYFLNIFLKLDQNVPLNFLPYTNDYKLQWTNKRFCEYFGITGYIDDDHAVKDSEWEIILDTIKEKK